MRLVTRTHQGVLKSSSSTSRRGQRGNVRDVYMESAVSAVATARSETGGGVERSVRLP